MHFRFKWLAAPLGGSALLVAGFHAATAYTGEQYAKEAKVTTSAAHAAALKRVRGTITDEELERERR